ncbi:MAG: metallophosphoesterase [Myxococcota bacterium]|nr:metallophosphoesterase [Myxococcota bacterium]
MLTEAQAEGAALESEPRRILALGDVHGDLEALQAALQLAGLLDAQGHWSGGESILVQTGDLLDRGDDEPEILALLSTLQAEAEAVGGRVLLLLGNHELMNVQNDLRYVTTDGFADYAGHAEQAIESERRVLHPRESSSEVGTRERADANAGDGKHCPLSMRESERARCLAFRPGGELARRLAESPVIAQVGESVFVHGGLLEAHLDYGIARINEETQAYLLGERAEPGEMMSSRQSPLWVRDWGQDQVDCKALHALLGRLGARRMVIGHTVQAEGINQRCDGALWRIDAGLSAYYGRKLELLELVGERADVLRIEAGGGIDAEVPGGERIP